MVEPKRNRMGKGGLIAIPVLVVILAISNILTYTNLQNQITGLTTEKNNLLLQLNSLNNTYQNYRETHTHSDSEYNALKSEQGVLETKYSLLSSNYSSLKSDYAQLNGTFQNYVGAHIYSNSEYDSLNRKYRNCKADYRSLSNNVTELYTLLYSYSCIPDAFSRTLNDAEIRGTSSAVLSAGTSSDFWSSLQRIYDYVTSNIEYAEDIDMPCPSTFFHVSIDGYDYVTEFTVTEYRNYVQTPSLTLEIKQGDCDDQAVLAYAMIEYYMKYIFGTEYLLYMTLVEFSDGSGHLAVILPVEGGQVCIVDPAGNYLTSQWGSITSKEALSELQAYSDCWQNGLSIAHMDVYSVNVMDGSYRLVVEGTITQVAAIFE